MISSLTDEELIAIKEKVFLDVRRIWGSDMADQLPITECTRCLGPSHLKRKQRCIVDMMNYEALCPSCWAEKRESDLINEAILKKPQIPFPVGELKNGSLVPLDLEDFCRI
jgi:hypothetical protein